MSSIQELAILKMKLHHIRRKPATAKESHVLAEVCNQFIYVIQDIKARALQYHTDRLYAEAVYLSRTLFDHWRDDVSMGYLEISGYYNPACMVSLYEEMGDLSAAELAQEHIVSVFSSHPKLVMEKDYTIAVQSLLRLYSSNQQKLQWVGEMTIKQRHMSLLRRALKFDLSGRDDGRLDLPDIRELIDRIEFEDHVKMKNQLEQKALDLAVKCNCQLLLGLLLMMDADPKTMDGTASTLLRTAAQKNHVGSIQLLLEHGADVNAADDFGQTALHDATLFGSVDSIRFLLDREIDVNAATHGEQTALHFAVQKDNADIVKMILERGADINAVDEYGRTALHLAVEKDNADIVKTILECGADLNAAGFQMDPALHTAMRNRSLDIVQILLQKGANVDALDWGMNTALHLAAKLSEISIVQLIIAMNGDLNKRNNKEQTALHLATSSKDEEMVALLIKEGIDLEVKDVEGKDALSIAKALNLEDIARRLERAIERSRFQEKVSYEIASPQVLYDHHHGGHINITSLSHY